MRPLVSFEGDTMVLPGLVTAHSHAFLASADQANTLNPGGNVIATPLTATPFFAQSPTTPLNPNSISAVGGSQPHTNFQPYLCVDFIISMFGIFPSPT